MYILFERKKDNKNKARRNEMLQKKSNPNLAKARFKRNHWKMQSIVSRQTALPAAFFSEPLYFCSPQSCTL